MNAYDIKEYCKARLQEIEYINHVSHTPSAMVALAAFVGYLSRLAFWGRPQVPNVTWGTGLIDRDEDAFSAFIDAFLPKYKRYLDTQQVDSGTNVQIRKHYWLYVVLRCGLVHSMSFYDKWNPNSQTQPVSTLPKPHVVVSHDSEYSNPTSPLPYSPNGTDAIIINAFDLCLDLRIAIEQMFNDPSVQRNAENFVRHQPPIHDLYNDGSSNCASVTQVSPQSPVSTQVIATRPIQTATSAHTNPACPNKLSS